MKKYPPFIILGVVLILGAALFYLYNHLIPVSRNEVFLNTNWKATEINGKKFDKKLLFINEYGEVGFTICNHISYGKIKIDQERIYFHKDASSALMACEGELGELETKFLNVFNQPTQYIINEDKSEFILQGKGLTIKFAKIDSNLPSSEPTSKGIKSLNFEKGTVFFEYIEDRNDVIADLFAGLSEQKIERIDAIQNELSEDELVNRLRENTAWFGYIGGDKDIYYQLFPGFYRRIYITDKITDFSRGSTTCKILELTVHRNSQGKETSGETTFKAQTCNTVITNKNTKVSTNSSITHCYLPLENKKYLAYEQIGNIVEGKYDLCKELENAGLKSWKFETR